MVLTSEWQRNQAETPGASRRDARPAPTYLQRNILPASPLHATAFELIWPIKASFVQYVERMSDGVILLAGGATRDEAGFHFPLLSRSKDLLAFSGSVEFSGHFGMLQLHIGQVLVLLKGTLAEVTIDDDGSRLVFASGHFEGKRISELRLSDDGAELFFSVYRSGEPLDSAYLLPRELIPLNS